MKAVEIRELSSDDLTVKLKEARAELFNLRFQMATSQLDQHRSCEAGQEGHRAYSDRNARPRDRRCRRIEIRIWWDKHE